jgi:phospholipase C
LPIARPISTFFDAVAAGMLPPVAFIDPQFLGEAEGVANDDHPFGDIRAGEVFLNSVYTAVTQSPNWPNTLLIINFAEWRGFFDQYRPLRRRFPLKIRKWGMTNVVASAPRGER